MTDPPDPFDPSGDPEWEGYSDVMRSAIRAVVTGREDIVALRAQSSFEAMVRAVQALEPQQQENALIAALADEGFSRDPDWITREP
jgi:hypothetical protein